MSDLLALSWLFLAQAGEAALNNAAPGENAIPGEEAGADVNPFLMFLSNPLNLILISAILFMFIVVRPQQKKAKQLQEALSELKKNDRVITASGIHATVVQTNDGENTVTIRIDENTGARMTVSRESIATIVNQENKE